MRFGGNVLHSRLLGRPPHAIIVLTTGPVGERALKVTVLLFASYKEKVGKGRVELDLATGATVGDLADEMLRRHPGLVQDTARLAVAVNHEFQRHDYSLADGDEVALIPPVSGGADDRVYRKVPGP